MFQIVPCIIADVSWKFHENPLIGFTEMLTDMRRRLNDRETV